MSAREFVPAPGWPEPPPGWTPHEGWSPDPAWPDPPDDWQFWRAIQAQDPSGQHRGYQRLWLSAYWFSTALSLLFFALAVGADDVPGSSYASLGFGATAAVIGSFLATRIFRAGVSSLDFDEATAAMRVLATAWAVLVVAMLIATGVGTGFGERPSAGPEAIEAVLSVADGVAAQIFGVAALFVIIGDSYTKSRRLLHKR